MESTNLDRRRLLLNQTRELLAVKRDVIQVLEDTHRELDKHITNCKIASTAGNTTTIVSTVLLFTPFALVGVGGLVAGGITTLGTSLAQSQIEKTYFKECQDQLKKDNHRTQEYVTVTHTNWKMVGEEVCVLVSSGYRFARSAQLAYDIQQGFQLMLAVAPEATLTVNGFTGGAAFLNLGRASLSSVSGVLGVAGGAVSAYQLVSPWVCDNQTLKQIQTLIDQKRQEKANLEAQIDLIEELIQR